MGNKNIPNDILGSPNFDPQAFNDRVARANAGEQLGLVTLRVRSVPSWPAVIDAGRRELAFSHERLDPDSDWHFIAAAEVLGAKGLRAMLRRFCLHLAYRLMGGQLAALDQWILEQYKQKEIKKYGLAAGSDWDAIYGHLIRHVYVQTRT